MRTITTVADMRTWAEKTRASGLRIGLVPTMGYLHAGHISLVAESRRHTDHTVVSIFVNPMQFGPNDDLERYPRDLEHDSRLLEEAGASLLFLPDAREIYPQGFETYIEVERTAQGLCGASRPGHFRGVATVVTKLFHITRPHVAVFGEKDWQQLAVIRRMVRDLDFGIDIIGGPIVRDADGLALSSRNAYLAPAERRAALCVPRAIEAARQLAADGQRDCLRLLAAARRVLSEDASVRIDYVNLVDPDTLEDIATLDRRALLAVAVWIGKTRLIDNGIVEAPVDTVARGDGAPHADPTPGQMTASERGE